MILDELKKCFIADHPWAKNLNLPTPEFEDLLAQTNSPAFELFKIVREVTATRENSGELLSVQELGKIICDRVATEMSKHWNLDPAETIFAFLTPPSRIKELLSSPGRFGSKRAFKIAARRAVCTISPKKRSEVLSLCIFFYLACGLVSSRHPKGVQKHG